MTKPQLKLGKYQHYKGSYYEVTGLARHSETEEWHVIYKTLYGDFSTWIRPLTMFTETLQHQGQTVERFCYVGS